MIKMKYLIIAFLFITFIVSCHINREVDRRDTMEAFNKEVIDCLKKVIKSKEINSCPNYDKDKLLEFYENELSFFAINEVLNELQKLTFDLKLQKATDTIVVVLFYPMVGFDPQVGYETEYYLIRDNLEEGIYGVFDKEKISFEKFQISNLKVKDTIRYYKKIKSGCETGYLILYYMSPDFKPIDCHVAIGIDLFN